MEESPKPPKPPKPPKKRSAAKGPKHQATADHDQRNADKLHTENDQNAPAGQMNEGADGGDVHARSGAPQNIGTNAQVNPVDRFTERLARYTAILAFATVVLAAATIALFVATRNVATETEGVKNATDNLVTATKQLVQSAKDQTADMKEDVDAARDSASAAQTTARANNTTVDILREQLNRGRANVSVDVGDIEGSFFISWRERPIEATISFRNTGELPAQNVEIILPKMVVAKARFANSRSAVCKVEDQHVAQITIGPDASYTATVKLDHILRSDERDSVIAGTSAIFAYGRIKYKDGSPVGRSKPFRLMYSGDMPEGGAFSAPPAGAYPLVDTPACNDGD